MHRTTEIIYDSIMEAMKKRKEEKEKEAAAKGA